MALCDRDPHVSKKTAAVPAQVLCSRMHFFAMLEHKMLETIAPVTYFLNFVADC